MQQPPSSHAVPRLPYMFLGWDAADPIGGVSDSIPVHPENKHPSFDDSKRKKNKRKPTPDDPSENLNDRIPDSDHQIDEYA